MQLKEVWTHLIGCVPNSPAVERHAAGLYVFFYGMVNIAVNNSYIVHTHRPENNKLSRRKFGTDLAMSLCRPHANVRLQQAKYLPRDVVCAIVSAFNLPDPADTVNRHKQKSNKRHRCKICPSNATFRGRVLFIKCQKAMCPQHTCQMCTNCYEFE